MSGVSGIINFKGGEKDFYLDIINSFNNDLHHRGPNNSGLGRMITIFVILDIPG